MDRKKFRLWMTAACLTVLATALVGAADPPAGVIKTAPVVAEPTPFAGALANVGFCCRPVRLIALKPTPDAFSLGPMRGTAEIDECLGMSFLRVVVYAQVPDGTMLIPVLPGAEPIMGDWFTITGGRGEAVIRDITLAGVTGRRIEISDTNFTPMLEGQF